MVFAFAAAFVASSPMRPNIFVTWATYWSRIFFESSSVFV